MRPEDILKVLKEQPFRPFRIYLSNGRTYEVRHPDMVWVGKSTIHVGVPSKDHMVPVYDDYEIVALVHINNIQLLGAPAAAPSDGNGS